MAGAISRRFSRGACWVHSLYVLHVFQKKSRKTDRVDIELFAAALQSAAGEKEAVVSGKIRITPGSGNVFRDPGSLS